MRNEVRRHTEPPRDCRRPQLLRGRACYEQDNEQVFTGGTRPCCADDIGPRGRSSVALVGVVSVADKIGCAPQTLHEWVKKVEVDSGRRAGVPTDTAEKLKALERENRELRQANEILRKASAYFAQAELDRPFKR
jgi:transposase-like protein